MFSQDGPDAFGLQHFLKGFCFEGRGTEREMDTYKKNKEFNPVKDLGETLVIGLSSKILTRHIKMFPMLETFLKPVQGKYKRDDEKPASPNAWPTPASGGWASFPSFSEGEGTVFSKFLQLFS